MEKITKDELEEVFLDVRKSYRLLYHHQRRILDLTNFIKNTLNFPAYETHPWFSAKQPRPGKTNPNNWSWDWLNSYFMDYHVGDKQINNGYVKLSIIILNDSGFFDKKDMNDKTRVEDFNDVVNSKTKLIFVVGQNIWDFKDLKIGKEFVEGVVVNHSEGKKMLKMPFDLSDFRDEETTLEKLKEFEQYCSDNDIFIRE